MVHQLQAVLVHSLYFSLFFSFFYTAHAHGFELISHKGLHHRECSDHRYECQSHCLEWKPHRYIENTIPAIRAAFKHGADRVEIDLQISSDGEIVVFHDNQLNCRAGINKHVSDFTVQQLKRLDIVANLKFLNRNDNPLSGSGVGKLPTLREVLHAFPHQKFLLNPKSDHPLFLESLTRLLKEFIDVHKNHKSSSFAMWGPWAAWNHLRREFDDFGERFSHSLIGKVCEETYQAYAWSGYWPTQCEGFNLALTVTKFDHWNLWGGPLGIVQTFRKHGQKIYALHVDDPDKARRYYSLGFSGIITSNIENFDD